ncbi:molybdopterin-dependent oxidoreductase, partial [uncultured Jatrophihabitans sp.]|uniref:molybdopterin-dependent oxidoreductase n=1 Tax=uncultured Jatrophihabitans sp. TaxID=1610747 RepID=UPI0035C9F90F
HPGEPRAGERGAVDAGALPTLLPGGRLVTDAAQRAEVEQVWGASVPTAAGHDAGAIWGGAASGALSAVALAGVDPADAADPALAARALANAGFVVSLEVRHSAVTEHADVVLPVAPVAEKSGRFVTWEGRRRPFELVIRGTGAMSDGRVLNALAEELDVDLRLPTEEAARAELLRLAPVADRAPAPTVAGAAVTSPAEGEAVLATWHELIDAGRMQDGDEYLAGTAKPVFAHISAATAAELGVAAGEQLAVNTDSGSLVVPVAIDAMPDRVVWLPTNARGYPIGATLGATAGATVQLTRPSAPPVIGADREETA